VLIPKHAYALCDVNHGNLEITSLQTQLSAFETTSPLLQLSFMGGPIPDIMFNTCIFCEMALLLCCVASEENSGCCPLI